MRRRGARQLCMYDSNARPSQPAATCNGSRACKVSGLLRACVQLPLDPLYLEW